MSEAAARHKIDQLLENAGWRFFNDDNGRANIRLEAHVAPQTRRPRQLRR